ncbi:MAG: hypothetical protein OHK0053_02780 [Microscillaceae bacterium]
MIGIAVIWFFLAVSSSIVGIAILKTSEKWLGLAPKMYPSTVVVLVGMAGWAAWLNVISLWISVGNLALLLSMLAIIGLAIGFRIALHQWCLALWAKLTSLKIGLIAIFGFFVLLQSTPIDVGTDESLYYIQTMMWMETFPSVKGLGNLSVSLAYNSTWHKLGAFWRIGEGSHHFFNDLNGFLYLLLFVYTLGAWQHLAKGQANLLTLHQAGFVVYGYFFLRGGIISINADFALALLIWFVLTEISYSAEGNQGNVGLWMAHFYLIPIIFFVLTIKVSGAGLALLLLFYFKEAALKQDKALMGYLVLVFTLFMVPYIAHNVILTGYPISPLSLFDFFEVDWKMPAATATSGLIDFSYFIQPFKTGITHHQLPVYGEQGELTGYGPELSFEAWILASYRALPPKQFLWAGVAGLSFLYFIWRFVRRNTSNPPPLPTSISLVILANLVAWLFVLPSWKHGEVRIVYGYWIFIIVFAGTHALNLLLCKINKYQVLFVYFIYCSGLVLIFKNILNIEEKEALLLNYWYQAPVYPPAEHFKMVQIEPSIYIRVALSPRGEMNGTPCYGTPIPCVPILKPGLELRGKTLAEGFRIKKQEILP